MDSGSLVQSYSNCAFNRMFLNLLPTSTKTHLSAPCVNVQTTAFM